MTDVKIYKPGKTPMSSGKAKTHQWVIQFDPTSGKYRDALMGWTSGRDNRYQTSLHFKTLEDAIIFAEKQGMTYVVEPEQRPKFVPKRYGDNFSAYKIQR